jgi:hypothetical protein
MIVYHKLLCQFKTNPFADDIVLTTDEKYHSVNVECGDSNIELSPEDAYILAIQLLNFYKLAN